ncbi:glycerophosphodiester phosphodiesterase [bacterium LRH843]|nr:glycerophosphodiester phosphodiesterase [bacterium LRH843]
MTLIKRLFKRVFLFILVLVLFMFLNNTTMFTDRSEKEPYLLAHRGLAQTFPMEGITNDTCTAERIFQPEHPYLENTIPSMEAAFLAGADIVELDVHPTVDGEFAVFHDWTLDCRTDGTGVTREQTMDALKQLDVGYGYTADHGQTFPFRGEGIGLIPTLDEVLDHFSNKEFLIHVKSNDWEEGVLLANYLSTSNQGRNHLAVYGGDAPIAALKDQLLEMRVMSKDTLKQCIIPYAAMSWTGYIPASCEKMQLHIPEKIAPFLWGWPDKFLNRMKRVDTRVIVVAGNGGFSEGFDRIKDLERLPAHYSGGIWTNRIDLIAPVLIEKK